MSLLNFFKKNKLFTNALILNLILFIFAVYQFSNDNVYYFDKVNYILYDNFDFLMEIFFSINLSMLLVFSAYIMYNKLKRNEIDYNKLGSYMYVLVIVNILMIFVIAKSVDGMYYSLNNHHLNNFIYNLYYGDSQNMTLTDIEELRINNTSVILYGKH
jgi:tryptophan-rich sensory protein